MADNGGTPNNGSAENRDNTKNGYDDIINHPHHISNHHPRMPIHERAAQFAPFAALTGYEAVIQESARLTDQKPELSETEKTELDYKLQMAHNFFGERPLIKITYFMPDQKKSGGAYHSISGRIKKIDEQERQVVLEGGARIDIDGIVGISGEVFGGGSGDGVK